MKLEIFFILIILFFQIIKSNINSFRNIILIRFHDITSAQLQRYNSWKNKASKENRYIYLTDSKYTKLENNSILYYINSDEVLKVYPSLRHTGNCRNKNKNFYLYTFHIEHIMLCLKLLLKKYKFNYVWILEQDVGFSGDINVLIQKYSTIEADIITTQYYQSNCAWYYCCTNAYMKLRLDMFGKKGLKTSEHIQRWSLKYIRNVKHMLNRMIHSQSEYASIEYSFFLNLTYHSLDKNDIGYKYKYNSRVSKQEWIFIMNNISYQNKLYHAMKF